MALFADPNHRCAVGAWPKCLRRASQRRFRRNEQIVLDIVGLFYREVWRGTEKEMESCRCLLPMVPSVSAMTVRGTSSPTRQTVWKEDLSEDDDGRKEVSLAQELLGAERHRLMEISWLRGSQQARLLSP
jgi:hypothetical protein